MTVFPISDKSYYQIKVDGRTLPVGQVLLEYAVVRSHRAYLLPVLEFGLTDVARLFDANPIGDGSLVEIQISRKKGDNPQWGEYRVFKCAAAKSDSNLGLSYSVSAYYNYPTYLLNKVNRNFDASSTEIASEIAAGYGRLNAVIDTINDRKVWRCAGSTLAEFFNREVVPHARKDDSSLMWSAVSAQTNTLHFRNVAGLDLKPKFKLTNNFQDSGQEQDYLFDEYAYSNKSGFANKMYGYGTDVSVYDVGSGRLKDKIGNSMVKLANDSNINKDLTAVTRKVYGPIDVGNTGATHTQNRLQNVRLGSLYSIECDVLVRDYTAVDVFDVVQLDFVSEYGKAGGEDAKSGTYVCVGKASILTPMEYCEKICFVRNSDNSGNGKTL